MMTNRTHHDHDMVRIKTLKLRTRPHITTSITERPTGRYGYHVIGLALRGLSSGVGFVGALAAAQPSPDHNDKRAAEKRECAPPLVSHLAVAHHIVVRAQSKRFKLLGF